MTLLQFLFIEIFEPLFLVCRKSWFRGTSSDDVVLGLIIANVAVFLLWKMIDYQFMMKNFTVSPFS